MDFQLLDAAQVDLEVQPTRAGIEDADVHTIHVLGGRLVDAGFEPAKLRGYRRRIRVAMGRRETLQPSRPRKGRRRRHSQSLAVILGKAVEDRFDQYVLVVLGDVDR